MLRNLRLVLLSLLVACGTTSASLGDELPEFQRCVKQCDVLTCNGRSKYPEVSEKELHMWEDQQLKSGAFEEMPLSLDLWLLGWQCVPNCDYQCQRLVTANRVKRGLEVYQFHGKWPFLRVFGIQELFSTLFSIGNWIPHYQGALLIWKRYLKEKKTGNDEFANLYWAYLVIALVAMCAWFFSTIFHLRDTWGREQLDYFFAGATVISGFYGISTRVFKLYLAKNDSKRKTLGLVTLVLYFAHVTRLKIDWSYTYNMQANVFFGLIQNVLWIYHSISCFQGSRRSSSIVSDLSNKDANWTLIPLLLVGSVSAGMSFELFDFAPLFDLIDAHALWHFVTIWPAFYWYRYMVRDVEEGLKDRKYE
uniref:Post-GPI attachment to proteins factor 3 n=1 Tax=Ogataea minuta TaxID=36026 RepID=A0A292GBP0_9ASCO|nr:putative GPI-phospholipase A2 [Ogataea minuta]